MSDLSKKELEDLKDEIQTATYNSVTHMLTLLKQHYGTKIKDDLEINNEILIALATAMGNIIALIPGEHQSRLTELARSHIDYTVTMTEEALRNLETNIREQLDEESEAQVEQDLAHMEPRGRC